MEIDSIIEIILLSMQGFTKIQPDPALLQKMEEVFMIYEVYGYLDVIETGCASHRNRKVFSFIRKRTKVVQACLWDTYSISLSIPNDFLHDPF